jgi:ATP-binding cassette subfamily B (MDR/TAP) protein 1
MAGALEIGPPAVSSAAVIDAAAAGGQPDQGYTGADEAQKVQHEREVLPQDEQAAKPVGYFSLFRFADRTDWVLMALGTAGAAGTGIAMPIYSILFGDLMNAFGQNQSDPSKLEDEVTKTSLYFLYLGLASLVLAYFQVAALTLTGVRQVNRMRHKYLAAVLRQDVGYFDTTATSGRLLQGLNEDCQTIQLGIGEKVGTTIFNLSTAIAGITIAFTRGWAMTLVMLAVTPVLAGMGYCIATFMSKNTAFINKAYGGASTLFLPQLESLVVVPVACLCALACWQHHLAMPAIGMLCPVPCM